MHDGRRPVVTVVDDDEAVRESLRFLLDIAGYDVVTFESADDYLDNLERPAGGLPGAGSAHAAHHRAGAAGHAAPARPEACRSR